MTSRSSFNNNSHVPSARSNIVGTTKKGDLLVEKEKQEIIENLVLTPEEVEETRVAFELFDIYGSGSITKIELQKVAASVGTHFTEEDVAEIVAELDQTGAKGVIDFNDFIQVMGKEFRNPLEETEIERVFNTFDQNGDMFISPDDMHRTFLTLGVDLTTNELTSIFEEYDLDRDGMISLEEFKPVIEDVYASTFNSETEPPQS